MPCMTDSPEERLSIASSTIVGLNKMLCEAMTLAEKNSRPSDFDELSDELRLWWKKHKQEDERRKKSEERKANRARIREAALKKLTEEEAEALGLLHHEEEDDGES